MSFDSFICISFFWFFCIIFGFFIFSISYFFSSNYDYDDEKLSPYECGFDPFEDVSSPFEIHFYMIAILFIIFDVEISFLFSWSIIFLYSPLSVYYSVIFFLVVLIFGYIYEWINGVLDWV